MSKETIIVSGASGNLGRAVVQHFLKKGARVIGLVHHQKEDTSNEDYKIVEVDLTKEEEVKNKIQHLIQEYEKIDAAVLTAGGFTIGNIFQTKVKDLKFQYQLNFITAYTVTEALLPHFKENKKGKIFFIGSNPGLNTAEGKGVVAYSLAKSQLFQLAQIINATFKDNPIAAHVIVPSTIDTPQNRKAVPDADFSKWEKPEDIAKIIGNYAVQTNTKKSIIVVGEELGTI